MKALTFLLKSSLFAVSIVSVREIISLSEVTPVPLMPPHLHGVMNLRGAVVPVIDLAVRLGMPPAVPSERTSILLIEAQIDDARHQVGLLVDAVREVLNLRDDQLLPPPTFGTLVLPAFIEGMVEQDWGSFTVLCLDRVLDLTELERDLGDVVMA